MDAPSKSNSRHRTLPTVVILLLIAVLFCAGGLIYEFSQPSPKVVLVFPRGFRGLAKVCRSDQGPPLVAEGIEEVRFDVTGRAVNGSAALLIKWSHLSAQLDDSTPLPLWDTNYRRPVLGESLGVWQGGGPNSSNDCIYFYVGSPSEADAFNKAFLRDAFGEAGESLIPLGR